MHAALADDLGLEEAWHCDSAGAAAGTMAPQTVFVGTYLAAFWEQLDAATLETETLFKNAFDDPASRTDGNTARGMLSEVYNIMATVNLPKTMRPMAGSGHKAPRRAARTSRTND